VLDRVESGGQTGADQAGWRVARAVGRRAPARTFPPAPGVLTR
jgi:hypothetical protein